jgi:hypothetical protein
VPLLAHLEELIYVAPVDIRWYLVGRGVARFLTGSASVLVTILFGAFYLHVPLHPWQGRNFGPPSLVRGTMIRGSTYGLPQESWCDGSIILVS